MNLRLLSNISLTFSIIAFHELFTGRGQLYVGVYFLAVLFNNFAGRGKLYVRVYYLVVLFNGFVGRGELYVGVYILVFY